MFQSTGNTGGLFGAAKPAATTTPAAGGLFGNAAAASTTTTTTAAAPATPATTTSGTTGGLFGAAATTTTKPTLNLFGSAATTTPAAQTIAPAKPLFGATPAAATTAPATSQPASTTGTMSLATPAPAAALGGGLFGAVNNTTTATPKLGAFGQTAQAQNASVQPQQQQQSVQAVRLDMNQVRGSTKFEDLSKEAQDGIIKIDNIISVIMGWKAEIDGFLPAHEEQIASLGHDVIYLERKYAMVQRAVLGDDVANIQELRSMSNQNIADAQLASKAVDNLKLPMSYHVPGLWTQPTNASAGGPSAAAAASEPDLISYFNRHIASLGERDRKLRGYISEIQAHMPRVEHGLYEKLTQLQATPGMGHQVGALEQIKGVLLDLRDAIIKQAVEVAKTREALMTLEQKLLGRERV
ncbi:Nucleoporin NUP49 [Ceratocystis fimbriata CBS 114723]|uniref:Nucleoporin NUP49 n=1 Tax=Ceratocystis fimbriata CBS 114723 TaxID=1035309 RepID=A0A2C5WTX8_9PEZI|nr:Nucleoporin NUP49 [Ceratocystis fimbriata CBS 114723]